ncbi:hypothetical protein PI125_g25348 [Phytophthora idaei]|nr:hypothetical protein PI125_g25348 [Phytophthora idaei]KAG3124377.1 hypothetical protein PI126_g23278 [Phytophthora idaei]
MSPRQASSEDFPRLVGAENFDVWKTRMCTALDDKHLGYVMKPNYDGISDEESEESRSDMSNVDDAPKGKPAEDAQVDSDAVDYDESDDEDLKPPSGSDDEDSDDSSDSSVKRKNLPTIHPINHRKLQKECLRGAKEKPQPLSPRKRRRQEAKTKAFPMKTNNTHVRLVKNLETYDIFKYICEKYEGASFHGDPYFIQHYLMEIKYEEGSDLTEFFLKLENAMKAASEATESVMTEGQKSLYLFHSMPKSWKNHLRIWKGQRKYIPYADLKLVLKAKSVTFKLRSATRSRREHPRLVLPRMSEL